MKIFILSFLVLSTSLVFAAKDLSRKKDDDLTISALKHKSKTIIKPLTPSYIKGFLVSVIVQCPFSLVNSILLNVLLFSVTIVTLFYYNNTGGNAPEV